MRGLLIGDSIVDAMFDNALSTFTAAGHVVESQAVSGQTLSQQFTVWQSSPWRGHYALDFIAFQCGRNNIAANDAVATVLARIDDFLVDFAAQNPWTAILLGCILPGTMTATQQGRWVSINAGVVARGGFDTASVFFDDNSGLHGLRDDFDSGDNIHPNVAGNVKNAEFFVGRDIRPRRAAYGRRVRGRTSSARVGLFRGHR